MNASLAQSDAKICIMNQQSMERRRKLISRQDKIPTLYLNYAVPPTLNQPLSSANPERYLKLCPFGNYPLGKFLSPCKHTMAKWRE
jgi:hypothetical protein